MHFVTIVATLRVDVDVIIKFVEEEPVACLALDEKTIAPLDGHLWGHLWIVIWSGQRRGRAVREERSWRVWWRTA